MGWWKKPVLPRVKPRCSFCNKWQYQVDELIAGPGAMICNGCVDVCNDLLADAKRFSRSPETRSRLEEPIPWSDPIECALCHTAIRKDEGVAIAGNRGTVCLDCVNAVASHQSMGRD